MECKFIRGPIANPNVLGGLTIVFAVFLLALSDAAVKALSAHLGLAQIVLLRSFFAIGALAVAFRLRGMPVARAVVAGRWVWIRSLCLTLMWLCYYAALPAMSLPLAAACYYTAPAWMALLSRFLLGHALGARRWSAILLALAGVWLAVDPGMRGISPAVLLPLAAAFFYALAAIVTWSRCRDTAPTLMAVNLNVTLVAASASAIPVLALLAPTGGGFIFAAWPPLQPGDWLLLAGLGLLLAVIATAVAKAYSLATSPVVGVFDNAYLLFAALWSAVFFGARPTPMELAGMALVVIAALLMVRRRRAAA